ncbi:hypothetical protein [Nocardiopsis sp. CA-288880]|uniref:hypothetical protein n=1 Tax=Nocardiopsis sp. CA-288880 TaxID=3239995 RepID=UPI003D95913E
MGLREKVAQMLYQRPEYPSGMAEQLACDAAHRRADDVMGVVETRVRELEAENRKLRGDLEAAILFRIGDLRVSRAGGRWLVGVSHASDRWRDRFDRPDEETWDRDAALGRAREIAGEEPHPGACSHVASGLMLEGSTCSRPDGHTGDHSDHNGDMWENTRENP